MCQWRWRLLNKRATGGGGFQVEQTQENLILKVMKTVYVIISIIVFLI